MGTLEQGDIVSESARESIHGRLDAVHLGVAATTLLGRHRIGTRNEWMREIQTLDMPPPSVSLAEMSQTVGAGGAHRQAAGRTPRRRGVKLGSGRLTLLSGEHLSRHMEQRLTYGQKADDALLARAIAQAEESDGTSDTLAERGIKPLMRMAESVYTEIQRDAAAALYSLSISDKNKVAFMEAQALETLVQLARSPNSDIRRNVAGALYRLAMHPKLKRRLVEIGVLKPLQHLICSPNRDVQRHAIMCLKELCENADNRLDVLGSKPFVAAGQRRSGGGGGSGDPRLWEGPGQGAHAMLDALFGLMQNVDPRVRRVAGQAMVLLLHAAENKLAMLDCGVLPRLLALLRAR